MHCHYQVFSLIFKKVQVWDLVGSIKKECRDISVHIIPSTITSIPILLQRKKNPLKDAAAIMLHHTISFYLLIGSM